VSLSRNKYSSKNVLLFIRILIAVVFIASAYLKLFPIEFFEYTILDFIGPYWKISQIGARVVISLEFFLGFCFLLNFQLKKIIIPIAIILLLAFSIQLSFQVVEGNTSNCGCFGMQFAMTPIQALLKNIILIILLTYLHLKSGQINNSKISFFVWFSIPLFIAFPFIVNPPEILNLDLPLVSEARQYIPLKYLYEGTINPKPKADLTKGKHIVAFFSLTCIHCKLAAMKLQVIAKSHPSLSVYIILNGEPELVNDFLNETNSRAIPHILFSGPENYMSMSGVSLPAMYVVNNSVIQNKLIYQLMTSESILALLNK
jgi:uncharacterized membrane protein YphA (DoxX/SURF4 family)